MNPRISFRALFLVVMSLVFPTVLQAGASNKTGNPFSQNGTFFNNSGTFSAIMRGQNLMGVTQFSIFQDGAYPSTGWNMLNGQSANTMSGQVGLNGPSGASTTNTFGTPGFVSLYYNGTTYNGPAFSVLNADAGQIASVFYTYNAGMQLFDPGSGTTVNSAGPYDTTNVTYATVTNGYNLVQQTTVIAGATNTYWTNIPVLGVVAVNSSNSLSSAGSLKVYAGSYNYYDGNWTAYFKNKYPNQVFNGSGVISLGQPANPSSPSPINQPNGGNNIVQISFQVMGIRVSSATSQIY